MDYVLPLEDASEQQLESVGATAARLGALARAGVPTPPGFVVTTAAFDACRAGDGPSNAATKLDPEFETMLLERVDELLDLSGDHVVALRRSPTTGTACGGHETYYFVARDDVPQRLVDCWRTPITTGSATGSAIIVQQMVRARASGRAWTYSAANAGGCLVESVWGLGAGLEDGWATPDRFEVTAAGEVHKNLARKRFEVASRPSEPTGARLDNVASARQTRASLDEKQLTAIDLIADLIRERFGIRSFNWSVDQDDVYVLDHHDIASASSTTGAKPTQRPDRQVSEDVPAVPGEIEVAPPLSSSAHSAEFAECIPRTSAIEQVPEQEPAGNGPSLTPLSEDLLARAVPPALTFDGDRLQLTERAIRALLPLRLDDNAARRLIEHHDLPAKLEWQLLRVPGCAALGIAAWAATVVLRIRLRRLPRDAFTGYRAYCEQLAGDQRVDGLGMLKTLVHGRHPFQAVSRLAFHVQLGELRAILCYALLKVLVRRYCAEIDEATVATASLVAADAWPTRVAIELAKLATLAGLDSRVREQMLSGKPIAEIQRMDGGAPFFVAFGQFVERHGHHSEDVAEIAEPRWREDPTALLAAVRSSLTSQFTEEDPYRPRLAARDALHQSLPKLPRIIAGFLMRAIERAMMRRDAAREARAYAFLALRQKLMAVEHQLLLSGALSCPDDMFFLTWPELEALRHGAASTIPQGTITRRRRRYAASRGALATSTAARAQTPLRGRCVHPGHALGHARLIADPSVDDPIQPGDILILRRSGPSWAPLIAAAAAVVVETGGYLSSAAAIARRHSIPCVVDVGRCTEFIRPGQLIRIDAARGLVEAVPE